MGLPAVDAFRDHASLVVEDRRRRMVAHLATSRGAEERCGAPGQALAAEALVDVRLDGAPAPAHYVLALGRPGPRPRLERHFPVGEERRVGGRREAAPLPDLI